MSTGLSLNSLLNIPPINKSSTMSSGEPRQVQQQQKSQVQPNLPQKQFHQQHQTPQHHQIQPLLPQNRPEPALNGLIATKNPRVLNGKYVRPLLKRGGNQEKIQERLEEERRTLRRIFSANNTPYDLQDSAEEIYRAHIDEVTGHSPDWPNERIRALFHHHYVEFLFKKSPKFPRARYHCFLCNYHLDTIFASMTHLTQPRHMSLEFNKTFEYSLNKIPKPSDDHFRYLTQLIQELDQKHSLNADDLSQRCGILQRLNNEVIKQKRGLKFAMVGSSAFGVGFRTANCNLTVHIIEEDCGASEVYTFLDGLPFVRELRGNLNEKLPNIEFIDADSSVNCIVQMENIGAMKCALLFEEYFSLNPNLKPIVMSFKRFADIIEGDKYVLGTLPSIAYIILTIHFFQQIGLLPILPVKSEGEFQALYNTQKEDPDVLRAGWDEPNPESLRLSLGELWIELLTYYSVAFNYKDCVVSISSLSLTRNDKIWNRKLNIEDPINRKRNLSTGINTLFDYIIDKIKTAYLYFLIPRGRLGPLYNGIAEEIDFNFNRKFITLKTFPREPPNEDLRVPMLRVKDPNGNNLDMAIVQAPEFPQLKGFLSFSDYHYEFSMEAFDCINKPLIIICKSCNGEDHLKINCPEENLIIPDPIPPPSLYTVRILGTLILGVFEKDALSKEDMGARISVFKDICKVLEVTYPESQVNLSLFGSTVSGFGIRNSDLDICLSVGRRVYDKTISLEHPNFLPSYMATLVNCLKRSGIMVEIYGIPTAKVPIIKFRHRSGVEGDISLSNILSLHNTRLLNCYTIIDDRLKILGVFLKRITKTCDINDASKGSLSSYAYILMLIHFLQQRPTPILPVLQELGEGGEMLVNGWNVWHFDDLENLRVVWPGFRANKESLGELWLGFLKYYTEEFNFDDHVISISKSGPLTRAEKKWYTDGIAIEDPFDKSHNISLGLSGKMSTHIRRTFLQMRDFFFKSIDEINMSGNWRDYYFDKRNLTIGAPPLDRQCRICRKIGHFAKNCGLEAENQSMDILEKDLSIEFESLPIPPVAEESLFPTRIQEMELRRILGNPANFDQYFLHEEYSKDSNILLQNHGFSAKSRIPNDITFLSRPILFRILEDLVRGACEEDKRKSVNCLTKRGPGSEFRGWETFNIENTQNTIDSSPPEDLIQRQQVLGAQQQQMRMPQHVQTQHQQFFGPPGFDNNGGGPFRPVFAPPGPFPLHPMPQQLSQQHPYQWFGQMSIGPGLQQPQGPPHQQQGMIFNRSGLIYSSAELKTQQQCTASPLQPPISALSQVIDHEGGDNMMTQCQFNHVEQSTSHFTHGSPVQSPIPLQNPSFWGQMNVNGPQNWAMGQNSQ